MNIEILQGDCLDKLKELETNSIDSIVTDPPYELGFMGKKWDNTGIANNVDMWKECLRVLKPGGHLLAFSGTRTYHRMASAIEDAGFEVRDMIEWIYGSGFPKSLNIGKAVDKLQGNERKVIGTVRGVRGADGTGHENAMPGKATGVKQVSIDLPLTKGTSEWEGWGTALKPAHEPICMARKPLAEKTVAENCLKWGTGGINIDESRVVMSPEDKEMLDAKASTNNNGVNFDVGEGKAKGTATPANNLGRFPANLIHNNSEEVRECFPETNKSRSGGSRGNGEAFFGNRSGFERGGIDDNGGNASRFFKSIIYQAKASKSERNKGCEGLEEKQPAVFEFRPTLKTNRENWATPIDETPYGRGGVMKNNHPTVKPVALMEYLVKMVTPKGGIVLDPFMGSGSTGVACKKNGYSFIGIDMTPEYVEIAKARINNP